MCEKFSFLFPQANLSCWTWPSSQINCLLRWEYCKNDTGAEQSDGTPTWLMGLVPHSDRCWDFIQSRCALEWGYVGVGCLSGQMSPDNRLSPHVRTGVMLHVTALWLHICVFSAHKWFLTVRNLSLWRYTGCKWTVLLQQTLSDIIKKESYYINDFEYFQYD